jgi:hypothetical protein
MTATAVGNLLGTNPDPVGCLATRHWTFTHVDSGGEKLMQDEDPDEELRVPAREVRAALSLVDSLLVALKDDGGLADGLASTLLLLPVASRLPEVGLIRDGESLRLHLLRLAERLSAHVPGARRGGRSLRIETRKFGGLEVRRPSRYSALYDDDRDLIDAFVWWDDIMVTDVEAYCKVLDEATDEKPLQKHFANNPLLLIQHLRGGHGRWVLSQKRLGSEYVPDFVVGEKSSSGFEWQFVELQSPRARLFVPSSGRYSPQFDEGIKQIQEWRRWLDDNRQYARNPKSRNGLGLTDVSGRDPGLLLIGREVDLDENDRQRRRQLDRDLNIRIHTYDWLIREAETRICELAAKQRSD